MAGSWHTAWRIPGFRKRLTAGLIGVTIMLAVYPFFFRWVESRHGATIHDHLLSWLTPRDVSIPVFLLIWSLLALLIARAWRDPQILLDFTWAYLALLVTRVFTIGLVPLEPPPGLIALADPIANQFYGKTYITRDLFFSGHTATLFLMFCSLRKRSDRVFALLATLALGMLLLIQHVHYTIDVVLAPVFAGLLFAAVKKWISPDFFPPGPDFFPPGPDR